MPVEGIHEARWIDGRYDDALRAISEAIDRVRVAHGLKEDEHWQLGEGPAEYEALNEKYDAILEREFVATLREFRLDDLADLKVRDSAKFDRLRERSRRSVFHRHEYVRALRDVVTRYEEDARKAASAGAFSAAVTALGAGVEGLLLLRCLRSRTKAHRLAGRLPRRVRPRQPAEPGTWSFETLIEVCLASGWLKPIRTSVAEFSTAGLAHLIRAMRNHVHPARSAKERPWCQTGERDYRDAESIYLVLLTRLGPRRRRKGGDGA
jgi:hypothetical protein